MHCAPRRRFRRTANVRSVCLCCGCALSPGMFAIRAERDYVLDDDFMKAVRKVMEGKKLEGKLEYKKV